MQLRKLVYIYLVRYSEDLPDIALLSISTFQKGLRVRYFRNRFQLFESIHRIKTN